MKISISIEDQRLARLKMKEDALDELGMLNHPKGDMLFDIAWADLKDRDPTPEDLFARMELLTKLMSSEEGQTGTNDQSRPVIGTREVTEVMMTGIRPRLVTVSFQVFMMDGTALIVTPRVRTNGEEGPSLYLHVLEDKPGV